jgi:hypothetical protein
MKRQLVFILVLVIVFLVNGAALAANSYILSWWTADGGGGTSTSAGPGYSLSGTIGQPAAGELSGTGFHLSGGFWVGAGIPSAGYRVYLPLTVK